MAYLKAVLVALLAALTPVGEVQPPTNTRQAQEASDQARRIIDALRNAPRGERHAAGPERLAEVGLTVVRFIENADGAVLRVPSFWDAPAPVKRRYVVLVSAAGRPVALIDSPESESGDWGLEDVYIFDVAGRTVVHEHGFRTFTGCEDGELHEVWTVDVLSPDGRVLLHQTLHGKNAKPVPKGCELRDMVEPIPGTAASALARRHLPQTF